MYNESAWDMKNGQRSIEAICNIDNNLPDLRDRFAIAALQGLLSAPEMRGGPEDFAKWAYEYADEMMAARKQ